MSGYRHTNPLMPKPKPDSHGEVDLQAILDELEEKEIKQKRRVERVQYWLLLSAYLVIGVAIGLIVARYVYICKTSKP